MSTIDCPLCQRVDAVQRVTAIVSGETHDASGISDTVGGTQLSGRSDYYAGSGFDRERIGDGRVSASAVSVSRSSIDVTQRSRLASRLAPPSRPIEPEESTSFLDNIIFYVGFVLACPTTFWAMDFLGLELDWSPLGGFISFLILVFAWGLVAVMLLLPVMWLKDQLAHTAEKRKLATAQYDLEKKRWAAAMKRWNAMFYCRRCDVVYVPGDSFGPRDPKDTIELAHMGIE